MLVQSSTQTDAVTLHSVGNSDAFVLKFDPLGRLVWSKVYGDDLRQSLRAVQTDGLGNAYFGGLTDRFDGVNLFMRKVAP
jgi:hypothetical protein